MQVTLAGRCDHSAQQTAVTDMDAIEIADGDGRWTEARRSLKRSRYFHAATCSSSPS
jgi:hypothetical protein